MTVLLYDGDCGFCSSTVRAAQRLIRRLPEMTPYQFADLDALGVSADACARAVQMVDADGTVRSGEHAVVAVFKRAGSGWRALGAVLGLPGMIQVTGLVYRLVARYRHRLPGGTAACALPRKPA